MSLPAHPSRPRWIAALLPLALALALALHLAGADGPAPPGGLKLEARLIWGANDPPATVKHNLADSALAATLRRNFKVNQLLRNHQPLRRDSAEPEPRRANERPLHPEHHLSWLLPRGCGLHRAGPANQQGHQHPALHLYRHEYR